MMTRCPRPKFVRATTASPSRVTVRCSSGRSASSTWSASSRSVPLTDGTSTIAATSPARSPLAMSRLTGFWSRSRGDAVFAEDVVQSELVVTLPLTEPAEYEQARHAEVTAGEAPDPRRPNADRPRRSLAPSQLVAGLRVVDPRRRREDRAGAELRAGADARTFDDHAPRADERVVLDDDRDRVGRLQHAADADAAG